MHFPNHFRTKWPCLEHTTRNARNKHFSLIASRFFFPFHSSFFFIRVHFSFDIISLFPLSSYNSGSCRQHFCYIQKLAAGYRSSLEIECGKHSLILRFIDNQLFEHGLSRIACWSRIVMRKPEHRVNLSWERTAVRSTATCDTITMGNVVPKLPRPSAVIQTGKSKQERRCTG